MLHRTYRVDSLFVLSVTQNNQFQRLLCLLDSGNVEVVVETLRLLLVISKRSRFLSQHLSDVQQKKLIVRLSAIAQVRF